MPERNAGLHVGEDLTLPLDAITQSFALLAVRRAGKSNAAAVMAEEMHDAGLPWVAIDPKGDWWGLRSSADGTGPGLPIPIFGGLHGDMPLVPEAGALMAELIVEHNLTCVLDVSRFSKAARIRFLTTFAERLYELHQAAPQPRHVYLEEADRIAPQRVVQDMAACVGAWSDLVRLGGAFGLGATIISQRSAVINKDLLTQVEVMVALRTTSPQDRKAIRDWMEHQAIAAEIVDSLPGLASGEAWISSSHWLPQHGQPRIQRARFRQRRTFDSGATPITGQHRRKVTTLADIDLGALQDRMSAVVEQAALTDPAALRRRIAVLEHQAATAQSAAAATAEIEQLTAEVQDLRAQLADAQSRPAERVDVPVFAEGDIRAMEIAATLMKDAAEKVAAAAVLARQPAEPPAPRPAPAHVLTPAPARPRPEPLSDGPGDAGVPELQLGRAHRAILAVLAQFPAGRTKIQVSLLSGYSVKSSGFANALGALRSAGLVNRGDPIQITAEGVTAVGDDWEPVPAGDALAEHWMRQLGKAERTILRCLLDAFPAAFTRDELAAASGYSVNSSGFANALGHLRSLQLVNRGAAITAHETFAREIGRR